ncbi:alpha/beta fold hydrolase [Pseudonocardia sp. ICBG1142]|uniref:alpha/beta fold hydrolase n=1 Tax=Pseudonocardia sp. ICBG1142 TaxID=2846760 RepID=UPI001CF6DC92|nr:alpha/beta hydrolase [Pseudonocardia sp. ICBG1142]
MLLDRVAAHADMAGRLVATSGDPDELGVFERVVSDHLALGAVPEDVVSWPDLDATAVAAVADGFDTVFHKQLVPGADGVLVQAYDSGPRDGPGEDRSPNTSSTATVLVPACGMPAALTESWMRRLAAGRRVVSWESRGLFGPLAEAGAVDTESQADDLFAVMDAFGLERADVVGLCGGAVIALAAAAAGPDRVASLSLWHGAYTFAGGGPRTRHQHDLMELMEIAALGRPAARSVQSAFGRLALTGIPPSIAHFALYPFANPELFYRYCRLNGRLARTDALAYLPRVSQRTLVVTSEDDHTAHSDGSRRIATELPRARLLIRRHGDHATLFQAHDDLVGVATDFMAG